MGLELGRDLVKVVGNESLADGVEEGWRIGGLEGSDEVKEARHALGGLGDRQVAVPGEIEARVLKGGDGVAGAGIMAV